MLFSENSGGEEAENECKKKKESGDKFLLKVIHLLFDQKKTQEKHDENESDTDTTPELILAEEVPDEMECQVKDNNMIDNMHAHS